MNFNELLFTDVDPCLPRPEPGNTCVYSVGSANTNVTNNGRSITYECKPGYSTTEQLTRTCNSSTNMWEGNSPGCYGMDHFYFNSAKTVADLLES